MAGVDDGCGGSQPSIATDFGALTAAAKCQRWNDQDKREKSRQKVVRRALTAHDARSHDETSQGGKA
jgi:hypothetical protein